MIRFIIFLALFIALIGICVYYKEKLGSKLYMVVLSFIIFVFLFGFIYTALDNKDGELKQAIINEYKSGKTLDCKGINVNKETHNFNNGTSVFIDIKTNQKINMFDCAK